MVLPPRRRRGHDTGLPCGEVVIAHIWHRTKQDEDNFALPDQMISLLPHAHVHYTYCGYPDKTVSRVCDARKNPRSTNSFFRAAEAALQAVVDAKFALYEKNKFRPLHSEHQQKCSSPCPATYGTVSGSRGGVLTESTRSWSTITGLRRGTTCSLMKMARVASRMRLPKGNEKNGTVERQQYRGRPHRRSHPAPVTCSRATLARGPNTTPTRTY